MAEKDAVSKTLESYNDIFADIVNVLLFNGRYIVKESELQDYLPRSIYKADDSKIHEQERDCAKYWRQNSIRISSVVGIENQTIEDNDMPLRVLSYDAAEYRSQLNRRNSKSYSIKRHPVVTLVLYFGTNKEWNACRSLKKRLTIPAELDSYVNDYKVNIFNIAFLEEEQVQMFQSDFKIVADYFVQKRKNNDYKPNNTTIKHVKDVLHFMSVMTRDNRFEEAYNQSKEGEIKNMCEILDRVENRGIAKGIAKGIAQGREEGTAIGEERKAKAVAIALFTKNESLKSISDIVGYPENTIKNWIKESSDT